MPEPQRLGRDTHKKRNGKTNALDTLRRIVAYTAALSQLSAVFDMRSENERSFHPDPAFPGADYIHIQVSESGRRKFTQSKRTFEDKVDDILAGYYRGEQSASERMREVYRSIVFSENTAVSYAE